MTRTMFHIAIAAFAALSILAETRTPPTAAPIELAFVNGEAITDADLKQGFVGKHGGHTVFLGGDAETRRFLDIVINERLLVQEAYSLGLDSDVAVKPDVDAFRDRTSADYLLKQEIDDKSVATGDEIRRAWEQAAVLFVAREIVADTRAEADTIRASLMSGGDFDALARACSLAPTRTRAGNLSPFTWGSLSPEVEEAVFPLEPGEISPVFHSAEGWAVVLLVDRVDAQRPALDDRVSARIATKITERKKRRRTDELSASLWKTYEARLTVEPLTPAGLIRLLNTEPRTAVAVWNGGQLTAEEAFTPAELRMAAAFPTGRGVEKVVSTLRSAVNTALIRLEARARKIDQVPSVARAIAKHEANLMESVLYSKHVLKNVKVEDDDVRKAYEAQKQNLLVPEKRRVAHIAVATEEEAKALRERIERGEDFTELLRSNTLDKPSVKTEGDLGWIEKGKVAEMYDPLFELPRGGVGQPIKSEKAWHIVRVTEIAPEHPLSFEEVREKLRTNLLEKKKHDARAVWIEKLRKAARIRIVERGVKEFVRANPYQEANQ